MHVIRLRGPWEFAVVQQDEWQSAAWRRFNWPGEADELPSLTEDQRLLLRRRFGRPTGVETGDAVWLASSRVEGEFRLNDRSLDESSPLSLSARNELVIRVVTNLSPQAEIGLEIR